MDKTSIPATAFTVTTVMDPAEGKQRMCGSLRERELVYNFTELGGKFKGALAANTKINSVKTPFALDLVYFSR